MGKTERGSLWLDAGRTSPYEYYQYWINTDDRDVERFLALFTFIEMDEVRRIASAAGSELRKAKQRLAFEVTSLNHGEAEAVKAREASKALFNGGSPRDDSAVPTYEVDAGRLDGGIPAFILFTEAGLTSTRGEARRLITQGGAYVNESRIGTFDEAVTTSDVRDGSILIRAGKKKYRRVKPRP
jgi:tyrosyl-tRNA synthetase